MFRSFFRDFICLQSLRCENLTISLPLSFLRQWDASVSRGETSQSIFLKMVSTLFSNSLLWTLLRIPTTSRHFLQEYWALAQHCLSIPTNLFDENELANLIHLTYICWYFQKRFSWISFVVEKVWLVEAFVFFGFVFRLYQIIILGYLADLNHLTLIKNRVENTWKY